MLPILTVIQFSLHFFMYIYLFHKEKCPLGLIRNTSVSIELYFYFSEKEISVPFNGKNYPLHLLIYNTYSHLYLLNSLTYFKLSML